MIAVWIIGGVCVFGGLLFCLPVYIRLAKCKGCTEGVIVHASMAPGTGSQPIRAFYEYTVDGKTYTKKTSWTQYAIFIVGNTYEVRYDINKPERSYMKRSGQMMNCIMGTFFVIVGLAVFAMGIFLSVVL